MNNNKLTIGAAALIAIAAVILIFDRGGSEHETPPERLFPKLESQVNDVASITIRTSEESLTLTRDKGAWGLAGRDGYPIRTEAVKRLVLDLAELEPIERKTSDPALYGRIAVGDPAEGGAGTLISLADEGGGTLAAVIVGERATAPSAGSRFVRIADDDASWLTTSDVSARPDPRVWLEREILSVPRQQVEQVTIVHEQDAPITLVQGEDGADFELAELPEDRILKSSLALNQVASALASLRLEDVRSGSEIPADAESPVTTLFDLRGGGSVSVVSWEDEEGVWAIFEVEPGVERSTEEQEEAFVDPAEIDFEQMRGAVAGWSFQLGAGAARNLRQTLEGLTDPRPEDSEMGSESATEAP